MIRKLCIAGAIVALAAGCVGTSPPAALWQLRPVAEPPGAWRPDAPGVFVGAPGLPRYLDRAEIVERTGPGQLAPRPFDRWAEPLTDAVPRLLAEELARRLASDRVVAYPAEPRFAVDFHVVVDVQQMDGRAGDGLVLVARWSLLEGIGGPAVAGAREDIRVAVPGPGTAGLVEAHSRALSELAGRIAAGIRSLPGPSAQDGG